MTLNLLGSDFRICQGSVIDIQAECQKNKLNDSQKDHNLCSNYTSFNLITGKQPLTIESTNVDNYLISICQYLFLYPKIYFAKF